MPCLSIHGLRLAGLDALEASRNGAEDAPLRWRAVSKGCAKAGLNFSFFVEELCEPISVVFQVLQSKHFPSIWVFQELLANGRYADGAAAKTSFGLFSLSDGFHHGPGVWRSGSGLSSFAGYYEHGDMQWGRLESRIENFVYEGQFHKGAYHGYGRLWKPNKARPARATLFDQGSVVPERKLQHGWRNVAALFCVSGKTNDKTREQRGSQ